MSEIGCHNCMGVCCQDMMLPLTPQEAELLELAGTRIGTVLPPLEAAEIVGLDLVYERLPSWADEESLQALQDMLASFDDEEGRERCQKVISIAETMNPGEGIYTILGRCGLLGADNRCHGYGNRPNICRDFEEGGEVCVDLRRKANLDVPV